MSSCRLQALTEDEVSDSVQMDLEPRRVQSIERLILPLSMVCSNRVPVELSLAGPAWWRRQETTAETREKAAMAPVYRPISRTRNVGKATWFSGLSVRPFPGPCFLVSWVCGRLWPLVFCSGSVSGSRPVVSFWPSWVVFLPLRVCFKKEATTQGTDLGGGRE